MRRRPHHNAETLRHSEQPGGGQAGAAAGLTAGLIPEEFVVGGNAVGSGDGTHSLSGLKSSAIPLPEKVTFTWEQGQTEMALCSDSCAAAKNGVCDEGRGTAWPPEPYEGLQVLCDLGTDCADCGPWRFNATGDASSFQADMPIKRLRSKNVEVRLKQTSIRPAFLMPLTNPKFDVDVSASMVNGGAVEMGLSQVWYYRLKDQCIKADGSRGLVVDVGGNFGWYSLFAAAMGCRVVAWEPVPQFRDFFKYGIAINRFEHLITVRERVVSDVEGDHDLVVPQRGIWGTAGVGGWNIDKGIDNEGEYEHLRVRGERVDDVVHQDVVLMKMDVEGYEPHVLESAKGLFEHHLVDNVVMEYSPGAYESNQKWEDYPIIPGMLEYLVRKGFTVLHVFDTVTRAAVAPQLWDKPPPAFGHITADVVMHDMDDARKMQRRVMGCNNPPELVERFNHWSGCNFIPEDLNPKSFRSAFGHNTNVFAVRELRGMPVGPPVGVFTPEQDLHEWFSHKEYGVGGRPCKDLIPKIQVRHRCPCTDTDQCGEEAKLVRSLAKEGRMTPLGTGLAA